MKGNLFCLALAGLLLAGACKKKEEEQKEVVTTKGTIRAKATGSEATTGCQANAYNFELYRNDSLLSKKSATATSKAVDFGTYPFGAYVIKGKSSFICTGSTQYTSGETAFTLGQADKTVDVDLQ